MKLILLIGLCILLVGCSTKYSDATQCEDNFRTENLSQQMAYQIYQSPNCYGWGTDSSSYVLCCNDEGAKYKK